MDTNVVNPIDRFDGSFEWLPVAAHVRYGAVPAYVTSDDFQLAAMMLSDDLDVYTEAHWHLEAIRERRLHPGRTLNDAAGDINARVAARLYRRLSESM